MFATQFFSLSYQNILKPIFFQFDPEDAHDGMTKMGEFLGSNQFTKDLTKFFFHYQNKFLEQKIHGVTFKNPIGLSAGFDKDAKLPHILPYVGFGFQQIGSVTDQPYKGNPKPRLYRLPKSKALVVYYGLKNIGADKIIKKLKNFNEPNFPLSISIAKTNADFTSTDTGGINDYHACLTKFNQANVGDFYTINISCPNTFGGEPFTTPAKLDKLLTKLTKVKTKKPIFVKMPLEPDWKKFDGLLKVIAKHKLQGVIISNLYKAEKKDKNLIRDRIPKHVKGGISGYPTWAISNQLISKTYQKYADKLTIIGVGGVFSAEDAYEKIKLGASLVQLITGMIYQGPQLIGQINRDLVKLARRDGFKSISEAVGSHHKNS